MLTSTLTQKGQATIPAEVRHKLGLKAGDKVAFEIEGDKVMIRKIEAFDITYHQALSNTLSEEWGSSEDDEAYDDL